MYLNLRSSTSYLTVQEALSGIFGTISLVTWIFLQVPQIILNLKNGNADGLSLAFVAVWLIGDITNLSGAIWASLVPTVITLAVYFFIADVTLLIQCIYYKYVNNPKNLAPINPNTLHSAPVNENTALLPPVQQVPNSTLLSVSCHPTNENEKCRGKSYLKNISAILTIILVGITAWVITYNFGIWKPTPLPTVPSSTHTRVNTPIGAQILGYISAICYLIARIPQIIKNYRQKSCEGLSLLFFLLSLMGNVTYGAGILCHSLQKDYVITNLPWLIGSLGTMAEDAIIFLQFRRYSSTRRPKERGLSVHITGTQVS